MAGAAAAIGTEKARDTPDAEELTTTLPVPLAAPDGRAFQGICTLIWLGETK
jgi:hypothetical protein